jgi:hypothetical protein
MTVKREATDAVSRLSRLVLGTMAALATMISLAVHIASAGGLDLASQYSPVWYIHEVSIVMGAVATIFVFRGLGRRPRLSAVISLIPMWAMVAIAIAMIYALANLVWLVPASGAGDPVIADHRFYFNDHGAMHQVTQDQFHAERAKSLRLYSAIWFFLNLTTTLFLFAARETKPH